MENRWNRKVGDFPLLKLPSRPPVAEDLEEQGGLGKTEHEVVDALLKTTTLISTVVTLGLYELE